MKLKNPDARPARFAGFPHQNFSPTKIKRFFRVVESFFGSALKFFRNILFSRI